MTPEDALLIIGAVVLVMSLVGMVGESWERRDARRRNRSRPWR